MLQQQHSLINLDIEALAATHQRLPNRLAVASEGLRGPLFTARMADKESSPPRNLARGKKGAVDGRHWRGER